MHRANCKTGAKMTLIAPLNIDPPVMDIMIGCMSHTNNIYHPPKIERLQILREVVCKYEVNEYSTNATNI